MKRCIIVCIVVVSFTNIISAQWTKGKGKGYYKLSAWYLNYDQHYTGSGDKEPNITRTQFNINTYIEHGLTNKLDIIAYIPFFSNVTQNNQISETLGTVIKEGESVSAFGDIDLGFRYGLYKNQHWAADLKLLLGLPTGDDSGGSDGSFQTGDGEFNQYISSSLGYSKLVKGIPFYAKSYLGYNNRTEGFSDEFRTGLETGIKIDKLWVVTRLNVVKSLKNGSLNAVSSNGSIFANNVEFSSYGAELSYYFTDKIGISLGFDSAFSGRIIAMAPSFSGGLFFDFK